MTPTNIAGAGRPRGCLQQARPVGRMTKTVAGRYQLQGLTPKKGSSGLLRLTKASAARGSQASTPELALGRALRGGGTVRVTVPRSQTWLSSAVSVR